MDLHARPGHLHARTAGCCSSCCPGAAAKVPDLVRKLGWPPAALDLVARGEGDYVAAPPTRFGARGAVQWARRPTAANRWLPDAEELISAAGLRLRAGARDRRDA